MQNQILTIPLLPNNLLNSFIIRGKSTILIDTGAPGDGKKIINYLKRNHIQPSDISLILLSHRHVDHVGGVHEILEHVNAPVAIHAKDAQPVINGEKSTLTPTGIFGRLFKLTPLPNQSVPPINPQIIFNEDLDLTEFGVNGRVIHTPGHTPGSVSVLMSNKEFIVADAIARNPFSKNPVFPPFHDNIAEALKTLEYILSFQPKILHVGHGGPIDSTRVMPWLQKINHKSSQL